MELTSIRVNSTNIPGCPHIPRTFSLDTVVNGSCDAVYCIFLVYATTRSSCSNHSISKPPIVSTATNPRNTIADSRGGTWNTRPAMAKWHCHYHQLTNTHNHTFLLFATHSFPPLLLNTCAYTLGTIYQMYNTHTFTRIQYQ